MDPFPSQAGIRKTEKTKIASSSNQERARDLKLLLPGTFFP